MHDTNSSQKDLWDNPMQTNGFEFVEFAAPEPDQLAQLFEQLGFHAIAKHKSKDVTLYRQGDVNFILNAEQDSFAAAFARKHGPCINAIAFRVGAIAKLLSHAKSLNIKTHNQPIGPMELNIPALEGIGGSLLYLIDPKSSTSIYDIDFIPIDGVDQHPKGAGLVDIDHLTHNVQRGNMDVWSDFYAKLFNFREVRYFDIEGKLTGLKSRAMTSPCGKIRIPINESSDDKSQIEEYLHAYHGEGVQHVALSCKDIVASVETMKQHSINFLNTPNTYFDGIDARLPGHGLDLTPLRNNSILIDGAPTKGQGLLLQIFTQNVIGPIFFELIERRGNEGFGEGNFQALFDSIEQDQINRGRLQSA